MGEENTRRSFLSRIRRALRPKISTKLIVYFAGISLIPMMIMSYILSDAAHQQLLQNASDKQRSIATDLARRVDNYVANDLNQLVLAAKLQSSRGFDQAHMDQTLITLFDQNATLKQLTLLSDSGNERTYKKIDGSVKITDKYVDVEGTKALDFLSGKPHFISPGRAIDNNPQISIGIPVLDKYAPPSGNLFKSQSGSASEIQGALVGYYDISNLWKSVLSVEIGKQGYAYVVDNVGNLIAHPDRKFLISHKEIHDVQAVEQFIQNDTETKQTNSETNKDVISTPKTTLTNWAVIVEEPVSSIYSSINSFIQLAIIVGSTTLVVTFLLGLFFSRRLIHPIKLLATGAKHLERGEFDHHIDVKTKDELQDLAYTLNKMAEGIKKLIEDLKANNLRLKFEQIKLNNIISSVSDGVVAVNEKGEIVSLNPPAAKLIDKDPKSLEGKLLSDEFLWEHDGERFKPDLKNGGIYHYTDLLINQKGTPIYLDLMVAVLDHQDSDVAAIITIHDQTDSRELSFMKLDFVAIAAHELRTPLTVVRGYLDMLNTGSATSELSVFNLENLHKATDGADQLRALINKLLNIARIERGDMEIFIERLNLSKLVEENVEQHKSAAAQKEQNLVFISNIDASIFVPADTASIVEVLNNLVGNAIKYTPKGGQIRVNLLVENDMARVEVVDDGPGIPEDLRDRLFTKFYRAERSLIAGSRGTGLGLFISKTIIDLQHGEINIEPDEGKGSTFYFTLPLYEPDRDDQIIAKKSSGGIRGWFKKHTRS